MTKKKGVDRLKLMKNLPKGQALLVTLLIMAVALTIGLSVASRSITDIRISQQTEEAARAFSAAEAGIEEALVAESDVSGGFEETGAIYQAETTPLGEGEIEFAFPGDYQTDEIQTLWLADHETMAQVYNGDGLRVAWGKPGLPIDQNSPALEASIYYKDGTTYKVGRFALDPYPSRSPDPSFCNPGEGGSQCQGISNFLTAGETVDEKNFQYGATLDISSFNNPQILLFARLRLLYSSEPQVLGAKAVGSSFPSQGVSIASTGQAGTATRKVEVTRLWPAPMSTLDFVLYSTGGLTK